MARHTFGSHASLCHVWAQQTVDYGKSGDGRMFFEGGPIGSTIYSHGRHFAIARYIERKPHRHCVLFNSNGYSVSTGKHKSLVRGALHGLSLPVFYVNDPTRDPTVADIKAAAADLYADASLFGRTTPYDLDSALTEFRHRAETINSMAEFFGLKARAKVPTVDPEVIAKVQARIEKRDARNAAKAERRRVERAAADATMKAEYLAGGHHSLCGQQWGLGATFTAEENAQHTAAWQVIEADKITAWREGKPVHFDWYYGAPEVPTMLRIKGDVIQTSRGAEFPVTHAVRAWPAVKACHDTGTEWQANGHAIKLGVYSLEKIAGDGTVRAGCHTVPFAEIQDCAKQLGLTS